MSFQVNLEHELDISWLIALWFAIHGGDPSPEGGVLEVSEETYRLANSFVENLLATYGRYGARALPTAELEERLVKVMCIVTKPEGSGGVVVPFPCIVLSQTPRRIRCFSTRSGSIETGR